MEERSAGIPEAPRHGTREPRRYKALGCLRRKPEFGLDAVTDGRQAPRPDSRTNAEKLKADSSDPASRRSRKRKS